LDRTTTALASKKKPCLYGVCGMSEDTSLVDVEVPTL